MAAHYYRNRHETEEGRHTTLKFLALEDECDAHNLQVFADMDKEHVKKGAIVSFKSSTNVNHRDRKANRKRIATEALSQFGNDRTWIRS